MRPAPRLRRKALISLLFSTIATPAAATECGDLRLQAASLKAAVTVEDQLKHAPAAKEAAAQLKALDKKLAAACAPRKVTISALPLAYVSVPPGNASHTVISLGGEDGKWALRMTTQAGAPNGIVFPDPLILPAPPDARWDVDAKTVEEPTGLSLIVALDSQLTVEEPTPRRGAWRIDFKSRPLLVGLSRVRACAAAAAPQEIGGARLAPSTCQTLLRAAPLGPTHSPTALPERGRAVLLGEWQFGDGAGLELTDELEPERKFTSPDARLDLLLDLSAPLPGISDEKRLAVSLVENRRSFADKTMVKLAHDCGEDPKCKTDWFSIDLFYDALFGVPFIRRRPATTGQVTGRILNRLEKPIPGQRVLVTGGGRRAIAVTDADGKYRFDSLGAGEFTFTVAARRLSTRPPKEYARTAPFGLPGGTAPRIIIDRLFE